MDPAEKIIGDVMKAVGYKTSLIGRRHLGELAQYHPNNRGFDEFYGFHGSSRSYFYNSENDDQQDQPKAILHNEEQVEFNGYLTDEFSTQAVRFIEENKDLTFFLFVSYSAVHTPMHATKSDLDEFKGNPRTKSATMTWSLDEGVGKIMDKLEQEGPKENTLVFFLGDNGGATNNQSSNFPLKGFKGNRFEGGLRTPFIKSWPAKITSRQKYYGSTSSLNIFATLMAVAGLEATPGKKVDGVNLLPFIIKDIREEPHDKLFWRKEGMAAVQKGDYKLIRLDYFGYRLYNLKNDLSEMNDLSSQVPDKVTELFSALESWEIELINPLLVESIPWQCVTVEIHKGLMENRKVTIKSPTDLKKLDNYKPYL